MKKHSLKLLVSADVLMDTLERLTGCGLLLAHNTAGSVELDAISYTLTSITEDFQKGVMEGIEAEEEARKRNRKRTTGEVQA